MFRRFGYLYFVFSGINAFGHPSRTSAIDDFCVKVRQEFVEAAPRYFSGPSPWVQLDRLPEAFADAALATVYSEGPRVTWVVLEMSGPDEKWFETTHYFFDEAGQIKKRERYFEHLDSNVQVEEITYFEKSRPIKTRYHHGALGQGKENRDLFYDPQAPEYTSTADLPILFLATELTPLAELKAGFGLCTRCTKTALDHPRYLLKFSETDDFTR